MKRFTVTLEDSLTLLKWVLAVLFVFLTVSVLFQLSSNKAATDRNYKLGIQNNTYLRTMVCISSVSPTRRTPDYVKLCYAQAEEHNHTTVEHFGDGE